MPAIAADIIKNITGSVVTTDGCHMVLQVRTIEGDDIVLAVPRDQIMQLVDHCAISDIQCKRTLRRGVESKIAVNWWNSALDRESREFILALTFGKGGALSFALTEHMAKALLATLRGHFEGDDLGVVPKTAANIHRFPDNPSERKSG